MIAMKLSWVALELLLVGFTLYFGSSGALAAALVLLLVPMAGLPVNLYLRKHMRVRITADANLRKGDGGSITVRMENPTIFPVLRMRCQIHTENQLNRESDNVGLHAWCGPKRTQNEILRLESEYCGRIRVSVEKIVLYDCFGLIGVRCKADAVTHMVVQPETFEPKVVLIPNPDAVEDSETYSQEKPGADLAETFQIREYVPGDSPRQIHWKLSSKFDRLIVRDPSLPITRNVLVFWERIGESGDPNLIDAQAETVVSVCRSLLDEGIQFTIGWNDTDRNLCILHEIRDLDELVGVIPRLLRATGAKEGISGAGLLLQTHPEALCGHVVYIAEEPQSEVKGIQHYSYVTALLCGKTNMDGAVLFDAARYREQLNKIEI